MRTNYYYDNLDGRRALLVVIDKVNLHRVRLIIRADRGQGDLLLNRTYTTRTSARRALSRRGGTWSLFRKTAF